MLIKKYHHFILVILVALVTNLVGLVISNQKTNAKEPPENLKDIALQIVAEDSGLWFNESSSYEQLEVINSATSEYPSQGKIVYNFKVMDRLSGDIYGVTLDGNGQEIDVAQLTTDEQTAYTTRYGRLEPDLFNVLTTTPVTEPVEVIIWLKEPQYVRPDRPTPNSSEVGLMTQAETETWLQQVDAQRAVVVESVNTPVATRLTGLGYEAVADKYAPVIYARLRPAEIREVAAWDEVDQVYLSRINQPDLEIARSVIYANVVHNRGMTGSDIQVAQIEVGGRIATSNPYLTGVTQNTTYVCSSPASHGTGVAGIIRSTHSSRRGIAPNVSLWAGGSCSGSSTQLQNRSTAAADWGARVLNLSWGGNIGLTPGVDDRFYDNMVINRARTVIKSAGNENNSCNSGDGNVTSPGLAYNIITVGNFDDLDTTSETDDIMDSCSSWRDPSSTNGDREKPEVAAPGSYINSTTTSTPWTGAIGSGTSYAAPMVTGVTALLMQRNNSLMFWPEGIKAILMATAMHNIEGSTRLSEYDGAGGIYADRADDIARGVDGAWGGQAYNCSTTTPLNLTTIHLIGGTRTRVVITWDNDPNYTSYASQPSADLDLSIINSSGAVVASSTSYDNNYEIVDFTPISNGSYTVRVTRSRCDYSPAYLGWALYSQGVSYRTYLPIILRNN